MNSRERFEFNKKALGDNFKQTEEGALMNLVNTLIDALYIPVKGFDSINKVDPARTKHFKIDDNEPINWGDLTCREVQKFEDGTFLVVIDEAAPKDCPTLCDYVQVLMKSYGWECRVETEW